MASAMTLCHNGVRLHNPYMRVLAPPLSPGKRGCYRPSLRDTLILTASCCLHHIPSLYTAAAPFLFSLLSLQGFYCVWPHTGPDTLVIGPYQGSLGCLRIPFSRGVCGAAASTQQTQLVPDVHSFEGHIACASR